MGDTTWERWGAASGLVSVAVGAAALIFERGGVRPNAPGNEITDFYLRNGQAQLTQSLLFTAGAAALLWFAGSLRAFLARAEGGTQRLSTLAFGAAVAQAAMNLLAQAFQVGLAGAPHGGQVPPALISIMDAVFILANVPLAVMLAAVAMVSLRTHAFPSWLGWLAALAAAAHALLSASIVTGSGPLAAGGWLATALYPALTVWLVPAAITMIVRIGHGESGT
ncbi:hypothetical protein ACQP2T_26535 [Nonomuraea sp. CA-143628]|uniref:hypothetical protein n=1 Tax=Nonomuraea sp. CA-143628 TaxID=3239997 RepID=UPI003D8B3863